jgi:plasmid stabilization system protein ParE
LVTRKKLPILWDRLAKESLDNIYEYILQDSLLNARKVKKELIKLVGSLNDFPKKYSKEEFLLELSENFRSVSNTKCKSKSVQTDSGIMPMNRNVKSNRVCEDWTVIFLQSV